jgi:hypothetical protein
MLAGTFMKVCSCDSTSRLLLFTKKRIIATQGTDFFLNNTYRNIKLTAFCIFVCHFHWSFLLQIFLSLIASVNCWAILTKECHCRTSTMVPSKMYHIAFPILQWRKNRPLTTYRRFHSVHERTNITDFSEQPIRPIFKGQEVEEGCPKTSVRN